MPHLLLLGTSDCHLCKQAELIINKILDNQPEILIEAVDIAEFEHWQAQYAIRIPVLYHPESQQDLGWPFDLKQVKQFISRLNHD